MDHLSPAYRLIVNGTNITPTVNGRLIDLTLDETPGDEADTLSITLSDHDSALEIPPKGAEIELAIGWRGQALVEKGTFIVDEARFSGPPDQISITARSADMRKQLPARQTRSWHQTSIGDIVGTIAANNDLKAVVQDQLASTVVEHLDQTDESDLNLLTRLGQKHDAIAAVKHGRLLFTPRGQAETVRGTALPVITVTPGDGDSYDYRETDREDYTGVAAFYDDLEQGQQVQVTAGTDDRLKRLRGTYPNKDEAEAAAWAELKRIQRGEAEFGITLARGRPEVGPEYRLKVGGLKPQINSRDWVVTRTSHSLSDSGMVSALNAETKSG
ncbi:contractile injection system protein, VgrG/Pvc8 family [Marinobacter sp. NFXS9]|uniref:contractile injection system protein, VgrG/Pvc8 family n=1 Tax=Marinobacter sp. NFXS9 TaxID=2818433 RepID=UPI0032DEAEC9